MTVAVKTIWSAFFWDFQNLRLIAYPVGNVWIFFQVKVFFSLSAIFLLPSLPPNLSFLILPPFLPLFSFFPSLLLPLLGDHVVFEHVEGGRLFITFPPPSFSFSFCLLWSPSLPISLWVADSPLNLYSGVKKMIWNYCLMRAWKAWLLLSIRSEAGAKSLMRG